MKKAYSKLEIKDIDDEQRTITGVASTVSTDRMGDIVEPLGAKFDLPLPLLWQHNHDAPIGHVMTAQTDDNQITIQAKIAKAEGPGILNDRLNEAWESIKLGLVRGFSIGFRGLDVEPIKNAMGLRFKSWEWLELSAVTIPANAEANIQTIKHFSEPVQQIARAPMRNGGYVLPERKTYTDHIASDGSVKLRAGNGHD